MYERQRPKVAAAPVATRRSDTSRLSDVLMIALPRSAMRTSEAAVPMIVEPIVNFPCG